MGAGQFLCPAHDDLVHIHYRPSERLVTYVGVGVRSFYVVHLLRDIHRDHLVIASLEQEIKKSSYWIVHKLVELYPHLIFEGYE